MSVMLAVILADFHNLLRRMRNLGPSVVFFATSILWLVSVTGTVVAFSIYTVRDSNASVGTSQSLTLLSSSVAFVFVALYLLAARRNEPVSKARPPKSSLHCACFIIMRITAILWTATMIVALGTTFSLRDCQESGVICLLQRIDMIVSILAILAAIAILFGLENSDEPFKTPAAFQMQPRIICRVSYFDDMLEHSLSRRSSLDIGKEVEQEGPFQSTLPQVTHIKKTSVSAGTALLPKIFSRTSTLLGDIEQVDKHAFYLTQTRSSHMPGRIPRSSRQLQSVHRYYQNPRRNITRNSMSSQLQQSSALSSNSSAGDTGRSISRRSSRQSTSPCSSISNSSRRSPLSTMRSVENPEIPIETTVHICPALRQFPPQEQSVLIHGIAEGIAAIQIAHIESWRRRASVVVRPVDLRRQTIQSKSIHAGMCATAYEVLHHKSAMPKKFVGGNNQLEARVGESGLCNVESVLDVHSRIIQESIRAAVEYRMQREQQLREQAILDDAAEKGEGKQVTHLIQDDEDRSTIATAATHSAFTSS